MNDKQLSMRLERVAAYLDSYRKIADIGSDHAYLPCFLGLRNESVQAIAGEINEGPFQSAKMQVRRSGLSERVEVRKGSGLSVIDSEDEVRAIAIAGMGGPLIASILEDGKDRLTGVERLVLQPNIAAHAVREWLIRNKYYLVDEDILEEDGKIYEILVAEPWKEERHYTEMELLLGPFLSKKRTIPFKKKWQREVDAWNQVLKELEKGKQSNETVAKRNEIIEKIKIVKEVLQ
ncbi:tRNA (adenine(22)-N(1))-methyltransferase TrmK [Bacillus sp. JCM 19041]|uniref:tRNA (adenine(22)-N(1))-methyltransferase n=1 Tax=Bacillus sp. JCM 19041 TaxID=1460637 RepID=UPI0006D1FBD9